MKTTTWTVVTGLAALAALWSVPASGQDALQPDRLPRATAVVEILMPSPWTGGGPSVQEVLPYVETQMQKVAMPAFVEEAAREQGDAWPEGIGSEIAGSVEVTRRTGTYLIDVAVRHDNAQVRAAVANALAGHFVDSLRGAYLDGRNEIRSALRTRLDISIANMNMMRMDVRALLDGAGFTEATLEIDVDVMREVYVDLIREREDLSRAVTAVEAGSDDDGAEELAAGKRELAFVTARASATAKTLEHMGRLVQDVHERQRAIERWEDDRDHALREIDDLQVETITSGTVARVVRLSLVPR